MDGPLRFPNLKISSMCSFAPSFSHSEAKLVLEVTSRLKIYKFLNELRLKYKFQIRPKYQNFNIRQVDTQCRYSDFFFFQKRFDRAPRARGPS
jgi:hypothetical protein